MFLEIDDLFDEIGNMFLGRSKDINFDSRILCDILEVESGYELKAVLPGVTKDMIDLSYKNDIFTIEVKEKDKKEDENYILKERSNNFKKRSIVLKNVDFDKSTAKLENGILTVLLPKPVSKKVKINID